MIPKGMQYLLGYTIISMASLAWASYDSLTKAVNFEVFLMEMTDGVKLGILINSVALNFVMVGKILQLSLFGELRLLEADHLMEKLPFYAGNLLFNLATTDNFLLNSFLLVTAVGFKAFHIILIDRADYVNLRIANNSNNETYTRAIIIKKYVFNLYFWLVFFFIFLDFSIAKLLVYDVFQGINSVVCLLFGFEFAIQGVEALTYCAKMFINIYELAVYRINEHHDNSEDDDDFLDEDIDIIWETKAFYSKGIDIASSSLMAVSYLAFIYLLTFHSVLSLPISMLQGTYSSLKQTYTEVRQLFAFIESSKRLDNQLRTATKEDLEATDNLCIICREDMNSVEDYETNFKKSLPARRRPKALPCGHILHMGCLKEWLERSDSCPLCRKKVFDPPDQNIQREEANHPQEQNQEEAQQHQLEENENQAQREIPANPEDNQEEIEDQQQSEGSESQTKSDVKESSSLQIDNSSGADVVEGSSNNIPDSSVATPSNPSGERQTIKLPPNSLLPPGWAVLPLKRTTFIESGGRVDYYVSFSRFQKGALKIRQVEPINNRIIYPFTQVKQDGEPEE
ncbi:predicted protein [Scheffersomyces stipitis CBS 6054]|uniref:RING-type E3 ubiquitin transferase n=1 Tax=Scheffersomyces stipitis (strain ATCC 58785 / CBS 6054 / NBRC 10063 / NRRL Y-11545) TaxID=322104 RepID=A3LXT9_PICST|nr:predicted protein [Scheffersomyces stipitis CBS 6054]ABN67523.2 predicted protein [Scheffersomyces stipitis CBS 6054]